MGYASDRHAAFYAIAESTAGTLESHSGADLVEIDIGRVPVQPGGTVSPLQRPAQRATSDYPSPIRPLAPAWNLEVPLTDLKLSATAGADFEAAKFLRTCCEETVVSSTSRTFTPWSNPMASAAVASLTCAWEPEAGNDLIAHGCRFGFVLSKQGKAPPKIVFKGMGGYNRPATSAGTTPTINASPVICTKFNASGTPFTVDSYAAILHSFEFDPGLEAKERMADGKPNSLMYPVALLQSKEPRLTLVVEAFDEAEHALQAKVEAGTAIAVVMNLEDSGAARGLGGSFPRLVLDRFVATPGVPHTYRLSGTLHRDGAGAAAWSLAWT